MNTADARLLSRRIEDAGVNLLGWIMVEMDERHRLGFVTPRRKFTHMFSTSNFPRFASIARRAVARDAPRLSRPAAKPSTSTRSYATELSEPSRSYLRFSPWSNQFPGSLRTRILIQSAVYALLIVGLTEAFEHIVVRECKFISFPGAQNKSTSSPTPKKPANKKMQLATHRQRNSDLPYNNFK
jgi:hypothetical protein